jgi:Lipocalin-like domain
MKGPARALALAISATIAAVGVALPASAVSSERPPSRAGDKALPERWVGTWRLTSETVVDQAGAPVGSLFTDTIGKLTYTARGDVWALVGSPTDPASALWYTGTAEVDRQARIVIHHVQHASVGSWIGTELVRGYEFLARNKRLRLSAELSPELTDILEWRRAGPRWAGPL